MPTYEYECSKCNLVFDYFQSMNDEPLTTCIHPEGCCSPRAKGKVKRLMGTGAGIIFKGSGFYETDYRSSDYKAAAKKDSEAGSGSSSSSSDSTPKADSAPKTDSGSAGKKDKAKKSAK